MRSGGILLSVHVDDQEWASKERAGRGLEALSSNFELRS